MMERTERLHYLIHWLLAERQEGTAIPASDIDGLLRLFHSLKTIREPAAIPDEFLRIQDEELAFQREAKGTVGIDDMAASPLNNRLCLWQGDITRLKADGIVNAANSRMLGCFVPLHSCIDNAIHSAAGIQMRLECQTLMQRLGREACTGEVLLTGGYNLPARYVLHTVGPIVTDPDGPTNRQKEELAACYTHCLAQADDKRMESIAFCCISTGVFRFPNAEAARIAVRSVDSYLHQHPESSIRKVVFNVFKDEDLHLYQQLLGYES